MIPDLVHLGIFPQSGVLLWLVNLIERRRMIEILMRMMMTSPSYPQNIPQCSIMTVAVHQEHLPLLASLHFQVDSQLLLSQLHLHPILVIIHHLPLLDGPGGHEPPTPLLAHAHPDQPIRVASTHIGIFISQLVKDRGIITGRLEEVGLGGHEEWFLSSGGYQEWFLSLGGHEEWLICLEGLEEWFLI